MKLLCMCMLLLAISGLASAKTDAPATRPAIRMTDVNGAIVEPLRPAGRANVLIFIRTDCPISNSYAPIINRLAKTYSDRGVVFYLVYTIRDLKISDAKQHLHDFKYTCPAVIDRQHELVKTLGAIATPQAFVITGDGAIAYHGRIDDSFPALGKQRPQPTTHELQDAIDAVISGKQPQIMHTRAIGCAITDD
jgi:hypothetical protein